jgi:nitrogen regulatory protein PII
MKLDDYRNTDYNLILTIVNRGYADLVVEASRDAGARGGTIMYARGTGIHETERFMDINIQPEKEIVMTLVRKESVRPIMAAILNAAGLKTKGRGISITLPVTEVIGVTNAEEITEYIDSNDPSSVKE